MVALRVLAVLCLFSSLSHGEEEPSLSVTQIRSIKKGAIGFNIEFDRVVEKDFNTFRPEVQEELRRLNITPPILQKQSINLHDNDAIATIAAAQLLLMDRYKEVLKSGAAPGPNDYLHTFFTPADQKLLSIQSDALDELIAALKLKVAGKGGGGRLVGTDLTVLDALREAEAMRAIFYIKTFRTVRDLEEMGKGIAKLAKGGGPYHASLTFTYDKFRSADGRVGSATFKQPLSEFLGGSLSDNLFTPSALTAGWKTKDKGWISGHVPTISGNYKALVTKGVPREEAPASSAERTSDCGSDGSGCGVSPLSLGVHQ